MLHCFFCNGNFWLYRVRTKDVRYKCHHPLLFIGNVFHFLQDIPISFRDSIGLRRLPGGSLISSSRSRSVLRISSIFLKFDKISRAGFPIKKRYVRVILSLKHRRWSPPYTKISSFRHSCRLCSPGGLFRRISSSRICIISAWNGRC